MVSRASKWCRMRVHGAQGGTKGSDAKERRLVLALPPAKWPSVPCCLQVAPTGRSSAAASALMAPAPAAKPTQPWASSAQRRFHCAQLMAALAVSGPNTTRLNARMALPSHIGRAVFALTHVGRSAFAPNLLVVAPCLFTGCPSGRVKCGNLCINPSTQCCKDERGHQVQLALRLCLQRRGLQ